jgi:hypothetical protein
VREAETMPQDEPGHLVSDRGESLRDGLGLRGTDERRKTHLNQHVASLQTARWPPRREFEMNAPTSAASAWQTR